MARKLDKPHWRTTFDMMTKVLPAKQAHIETASLKLGDQVAAEWLPLIGIAYEPKSDVIEIALEGLDHLINGPREVWLEDETGDVSSIEIVDAADVRRIIMFRDPLALPSPQDAARAH
jgi:hypothetical protein